MLNQLRLEGITSLLTGFFMLIWHWPPYLSFLVAIVLLVNVRSLPLVWHLRMFRHPIVWHLRKLVSPDPRIYMEKRSPVAHDPFGTTAVHTSWAGPDDCDFLGHLSNSAYAKNLDIARMTSCIQNLGVFLSVGGFMPLAGANYLFLKEIPMLSSYEMRSKIGSWDEKWIYIVTEFTTRPGAPKGAKAELAADYSTRLNIDRPGHKRYSQAVRGDGTVTHCVAVSKYCFKLGRLTVPPRIALCICGFGADRQNWIRSAALQENGELRRFLEGGWREQSGWDLPEFEYKRQIGMEWCCKLSEGIAAANYL